MKKILFILIISTAAILFIFPSSAEACGDYCYSFYEYPDCPGGDISSYGGHYCASTEICSYSWSYVSCASTGGYDQYAYGSCVSSASCQPSCSCTPGSSAGSSCTSCNYRTPRYYNCNCTTYAGSAYYDASCACLYPNGTSCTANSQCSSGYCVDGYCCNWACNGTCMQCNLSGYQGTCYYSSSGQDPANECYGTGTCGGTCNGSGGCQYPSTSVTCSSLQDCDYLNYYYQSGTESPTATEYCYYRDYADNYQYCNAAGSCSALSCSYGDSLQYSCGTCKYISASNCTGGTLGSCTNYSKGTSCGTNQECNGSGTCVNCATPTGTISASKTSVQTGEQFTITVTGYDDYDVWYLYTKEGAGGAWDSQLCLGSQTSCAKTWNFTKTTAGTYQYYGWVMDSDNVNGCANYHEAGTSPTYVTVTVAQACKSQGTGCSLTSECCAGSCVDGVCCNSSCTGTCVSCNLAGGVGVCSYIPSGQDPADECTGTGTCGGTCNGSGVCQYPAAGTDCGVCKTCNGSGSCNQTSNDPGDCGGTDRYCSSGSCISCTAPYKNCDLNPVNGCEVNTNTNSNNCGSCGNVCLAGVCTNGSCAQGDCDAACRTRGYPGGYCAARDWAREQCVLGGYSSEVVDIGFQGKCTVPPVLIGSCQCCQSMINTKIDVTAYGTNSIFNKSSVVAGEQVAVGGYLRKTSDSTGISGKYLSLWDCTGACVQVTEGGMNSIGPTDSTGYAGKYWTPSSGYQGTRNYLLLFGGDGSYNQSQTSNYSLTVTAACAAPGIPANPCSQQSAHAINFSWNAVSGATSYRVEWCNSSYSFGDANCCSGTCYGVTSNTQYYAYGLNTGTAYRYRVRVEAASSCAVPGNWSSTQQCATLSQDVVDCNNECSRRGYANPGDCYPLIGGYIPCGGSQTNYGDPIGKYGACSGLFVGGCVCCHNCPSSPPSDYVTVGSCSVSITGKGWDATDGVIFGYRHLDKDTTWRKFSMDDNPGDSTCGDNLKLQNSWSVSGDTIIVQTDVLGKSATHSLGGGFDFNPGGCKYTVSKIGVAGNGNETYTNGNACMTGTNPLGITGGAETSEYVRWLIDMEYCGDGETNCGEACDASNSSDPNKAICTNCSLTDITLPVITLSISATKAWLKDGSYVISITDSDPESGLNPNECKYKIEEYNIGGTIFLSDKRATTSRQCNPPSGVGIIVGSSASQLNSQGQKTYKFIATAKNTLGLEGRGEMWLNIDYTIPTTR